MTSRLAAKTEHFNKCLFANILILFDVSGHSIYLETLTVIVCVCQIVLEGMLFNIVTTMAGQISKLLKYALI